MMRYGVVGVGYFGADQMCIRDSLLVARLIR